jgi:iron complex outermembrane receptor protein
MRHAGLMLGVSVLCVLAATAAAQQAAPDAAVRLDPVVVSAPLASSRSQIVEGVTVLEGARLERLRGGNLGEMLERTPGVSSTQFGPGASRPVIRGQGGPRVRVLQNGTDSFDASVVSPDHAVTVPPGGIRRIEVLRGPAGLLYGSSAIGGVVNVIDGRIPDAMPAKGAAGEARLGYGTGAGEASGFAGIDAAVSDRFVLHGEGGFLDANDYRSAGTGRIDNSAMRDRNGAIGGSWLGDRGHAGLSVARFESYYGIPGGGEESGVRIDMDQTRLDTRFGRYEPFGFLDELRVSLGYADYAHREIEGSGEVGTRFSNDSWETRIEAVHRPLGGIEGVIGLQGGSRDFSAVGEEAFVPPTVTDTLALFALERLEAGPWLFSLGGRIERQQIEAGTLGRDRRFNAWSAAASATYRFNDAWSTGLSLSRTERGPGAEELFSDGPHLATRAFERGDASLGKEIAWHAEWSLKRVAGDVTGGLNLFATRYRDFIFGDFTGEEEDGLQVLQYRQTDADFIGGELELGWIFHRGPGYTLGIDGALDYVEARQRNGAPLPLIPPFGYSFGFNVETAAVDFRAGIDGVLAQDRNAPHESETGGYTLLNAAITWRPFASNRNIALLLQGRNLTDEDGRNHVSLLKDEVPIRGREARLDARVTF